ncbi:MAG: glycoside hydrolase family 3 C-terminal domain-containing protein [Bacilli bacterium]
MLSNAKAFSDTAIIVLSRIGGENMGEIPTKQTLITENGTETDESRTYQDTTKYEDELIKMAHENFKNVIVIVNTCNTMHLGIVDTNNVDSAIYVGLTGQSAATAIPESYGEKFLHLEE